MTPVLANWIAVAAAAFSAELLTLASPPMDQGWLAWIALIPYFMVLLAAVYPPAGDNPENPRPHVRRAGWAGFAFGFTFLMLLVPWFGAFTPVGYPIGGIAWGLVSGLVALATTQALARLPATTAPVVLAAGWTVFEWVRAQGALAFPWGTLSATQHRYLPVLQILDLTGAYGLSFLMALASAAVSALLLAAWRRSRATRAAALGLGGRRWAAVALGLVGLAVIRGQVLLAQPAPASARVRVGVVQASQSIRTSGAAVQCISPVEDYDAWTQEAIRRGAELVVWPESARPADVVHNSFAREGVERLVRGTGSHLLAGSFVVDPASELDTNAAVMFSPEGEIRGQYAKVLIVPFGEYLPARPLFFFAEKVGWPVPPEDLHPGGGWQPVTWPGGKVGVSICFESAFGYVSRAYVKRGANLLAVMTSDGWAGRTAAGLQHAAFAPLRAVETRRAVARAAATGVSELIDPYGRILQSVPMFERGVAVGELPLRTDLTLYARLGDWPVLLAWGILLLPGVAGLFSSRLARTDDLKSPKSG